MTKYSYNAEWGSVVNDLTSTDGSVFVAPHPFMHDERCENLGNGYPKLIY